MNIDRMKEIREYFDNTQEEISEILGTTRSTYANWENLDIPIPLDKLNIFCNYYGISLDYICGLTNTKKNKTINDKIDIKNIGNKLKEIRTSHNETQSKIADIIQVDQSNYSKWELGKLIIKIYPLIEFAKHYNISIDYICGKTNDKTIQ